MKSKYLLFFVVAVVCACICCIVILGGTVVLGGGGLFITSSETSSLEVVNGVSEEQTDPSQSEVNEGDNSNSNTDENTSIEDSDPKFSYPNKQETANFIFAHPDSWEYRDSDSLIEAMVLSPLGSGDVFRENINFIKQDQVTNDYTLQEYYELNIDQLDGFVQNFSIKETSDIQVSDLPAKVIIYDGMQSSISLRWKQVYIVDEGKAYVITYTAKQEDFSQFEEVFDTIVAELRLK